VDPQNGYSPNWFLMKTYFGGMKTRVPREKLLEQEESQHKLNLTYDSDSRIRTPPTLTRGEYSHHCTIPAPQPSFQPENENWASEGQ